VAIGTAHVVCRAKSRKWYGVRLSVHLSVPSWALSSKFGAAGLLLWAQWLGHIDLLHHQMQAVPQCQCTYVAERRLVEKVLIIVMLDIKM